MARTDFSYQEIGTKAWFDLCGTQGWGEDTQPEPVLSVAEMKASGLAGGLPSAKPRLPLPAFPCSL